ncbi:EAL domain-containing protein [Altererythrobacter sp. CC-YST694]|uniref:putative bifunctional diguanylate cyclase/phosphodiesterase n=1 Tax=Altererythrobacter sp. CC-YST694 TaxID=2755038 RepID=UPI001D0160BC|nr:EAL domain-containing protein [Altererythrobacter sp. CC-YST694]MCB5424207.1 EAL domain-containing protein [Altererythrobacter sp. CC-YST694]
MQGVKQEGAARDVFDADEREALRAAEEAAALAQKRLREAIDVLPEGIVFLDAEGRYILWNQEYAKIYTRSADLLRKGARLADTLRVGVARGDYPEAMGREDEWIARRLALIENPGEGTRHEQTLSNGKTILIEERRTADGGTIGLRVDVTDMKRREQGFRLLFDDNPVPLLVYDPASETIRRANDAAAAHFGYSREEFSGLPASRLFAPEEWGAARELLVSDHSQKDRFWQQCGADGTRLESVLFTRRTNLEDGIVTILSVFDVTERRRAEARLAYMARHDELTGLANRVQCREQLNWHLGHLAEGDKFTLAMVDLDHFKDVNDTYGHQPGDALLAEAAFRMSQVVPEGALLCRLGGDEFAILLPGFAEEAVAETCRTIIAEISRPFFVGEHVLRIGATIGVAYAPRDSRDSETLLRYADLALYSAKSGSRGTVREFELAMDHAAQERTRLENDFRNAVLRGELEVHYQPLIDLHTEEIDGYEALLRWNHPERGAVSPEVFIPLAEEMGLIDIVGQQVLRIACVEAASWPEKHKLAVNVSPLQFRNGHLHDSLLQALAWSGLEPSRLELEITEAVLIEQGEQTSTLIRRIRDMGIGISMDDFGTGYSSLSYLLQYPFTKIKIDKSFVLRLAKEPESRAVVRAIIGLGRSLGLTVTAEGVEQEDVLACLREEGCGQAQGYLFGKARPGVELGTASPPVQAA